MISDIITQKENIIKKINKAGIPKSNLKCILLFGSHYWGYDTSKSDIDLYIILNKKCKKVLNYHNLSLHYQITENELNEKIKEGGWASYFCVNFSSYVLYGVKPKTVSFHKDKIVDYLKGLHNSEFNLLLKKTRSWCFQALMKRVFFLNYYYNDINNFKLTDFQLCPQLKKMELKFLEDQYIKIFNHRKENPKDLLKIKKLIEEIEEIIMSKLD